MGLTTGAVTGAIDRLEKAGYARRGYDPKDRRLTIVEPTGNKKYKNKIEMIFAPLHERMHKLLYSTILQLLPQLLMKVKRKREEAGEDDLNGNGDNIDGEENQDESSDENE